MPLRACPMPSILMVPPALSMTAFALQPCGVWGQAHWAGKTKLFLNQIKLPQVNQDLLQVQRGGTEAAGSHRTATTSPLPMLNLTRAQRAAAGLTYQNVRGRKRSQQQKEQNKDIEYSGSEDSIDDQPCIKCGNEKETPSNPILICDTCNALHHLKCLLAKVLHTCHHMQQHH